MSHAPAAAYYVALAAQVQAEGVCDRCRNFSPEVLRYDVCPYCAAHEAEHGPDVVDCSGSWL